MGPGVLNYGKYTVDVGAGGCSVYALKEDQKVFLCGGIANPEMAMSIVEGLILLEAKQFYVPEAGPKVTGATKVKEVPALLKRKSK